MRRGLSEAEVQAALGDLDGAALPARTVAALRLADCLSGERPLVDEALFAELRRHFDEGQILELGAALTVASGWQRFIEAFGIRPDGWTEATPLPWKDRPGS
jgi:alkylhydroperoxidase family enzyme